MQFLTIPFFSALENSQNILIAGAGGGFDIFCGLPLYFALKNAGKQVHLANMSFSDLHSSNAHKLDEALFEVKATTQGWEKYFPELHLSRWFTTQNQEVPIYCFDHTGFKPIQKAYQVLIEHLKIDAIILVDGGTDSLMRGDEVILGTPNEEAVSIEVINQLNIPTKLLVCLGFGIDDVCHANFLEAIADITKTGGFLGAWTLTNDMPEVSLYREAAEFTFKAMSDSPSVISTSVFSALEGHFGDYHMTNRTRNSQLFINPLMTMYWCLNIKQVADRILYLDYIRDSVTYRELTNGVKQFRQEIKDKIRPWVNLPM